MDRTRTYECMCLLDNREVRKGWQPLKDAVTGLFTKHGAEIVSARRWDERRLAYQLAGQQRGTYMLTYFNANTQQVAGIRRDLQFNESVLRSLILTCADVPASAHEPEPEFDVNAIPVDDAPEPARIEEPVQDRTAEAVPAPTEEAPRQEAEPR